MLNPKKVVQAVNELKDVDGVPHGQIKNKISWGALFIYILAGIAGGFMYLYVHEKNTGISRDEYLRVVVERDYYRIQYDSLVRSNYVEKATYAKSLEDKIYKLDSLNNVLQNLEYRQKVNATIYNQTVKELKNAAN